MTNNELTQNTVKQRSMDIIQTRELLISCLKSSSAVKNDTETKHSIDANLPILAMLCTYKKME